MSPETRPAEPAADLRRVVAMAARCAAAGLVLAGAVGTAALAFAWALPAWRAGGAAEAVERALRWAALHGLLVGAEGLALGSMMGVFAAAGPGTTRKAAAALGAAAGALMGLSMAALLADEPSGGPVAVASVLAQVVTGATLGALARPRRR